MKKISIITGGNRGLGFCIAKRLIDDGKKVCIISRTCPNTFKEFMKTHPDTILFYQEDIANDLKIKDIIDSLCKNYEIEYLINNAGVIQVGDFENNDFNMIKDVFNSCTIGTIIVTRHCLPYMKKSNTGKIVIINSSAGLLGKPKESVYCASKFAQRGYALALKEELKNTNIKLIECYPGGINTEFYDKIRDYAPIEVTNKFMDPQALANIICENIYASNTLNIAEIKIERL